MIDFQQNIIFTFKRLTKLQQEKGSLTDENSSSIQKCHPPKSDIVKNACFEEYNQSIS